MGGCAVLTRETCWPVETVFMPEEAEEPGEQESERP
jgi:hypothetical protein